MGVRRCRSISFWTKTLGTDNRANPSTMVSGCTRFSQALCCGVSGAVSGDPLADSPLSSERTAFHTVANPEPGSSVNDTSPWSDCRATTPGGDKAPVHMVIHRCGKDG